MKKENTFKFLFCSALAVTVCFLCMRYSSQVLSLFSFLASESAVRYLPTVPFSFETLPETETKTIEETSETKTTEETSETKSITVLPTEKMTEKKTSKTTKKKEEEEFFVLPDDISQMMKTAKEKGANEEKTGSIYEKQYVNEGVTDKEGVVKVKNTNSTKIDLKSLLQEKADLSVNKEEPSVLIFHTHTTESYQYIDRSFFSSSYTTRNNSSDRNMVRIGDAIKSEIEKAGFNVIHDTTIHDAKYSGAYSRSRKTVEAYLQKYPSIKIVLDIHRDGIVDYDGTKIKPTAVIDGKKVAQVMIISGCQESGNGITGYENWKENLVFALKLQKEMEETFPGLTRPIFFCGRKYNMDMTEASLLIEVGSDSNTIEEAYYAGLCIGKSLSQLLLENGEK